MAFQTIHVTPGLGDRAHRSGPWAVASAHDPAELMRRAGFVEIHATDQTDEFRTTARAWIDQWDQHRTALVELSGDTAFETRQNERRIQLQAIEDGLLQRSLVLGTSPTPSRKSTTRP